MNCVSELPPASPDMSAGKRPRFLSARSSSPGSIKMQVKVRPINIKGRPLFRKDRLRSKSFAGELEVIETREERLGRGMTTAKNVPRHAAEA
jgi:hypothetical protein